MQEFSLQNNETALHYASREGLLPIVEILTSFGCRMDTRNKADATALHIAARHGHIEIARFLCLAGLNINIQDKVSTNRMIFPSPINSLVFFS